MKNLRNLKENCKLSVCICQIAKNLWFNKLKQEKNISSIDDLSCFSNNLLENVEDIVILNDTKINLYKKLQQLDEKTRDVIYLRLTGELSFKEIATILNKSENWARVTFYRGKEKLKEDFNYEE